MKYFVLSSSGSTMKMADFSEQKVSVSSELSKHRICSISLSRKAFRRLMAVDSTDAMAWSAELSAAPANHFALWSDGSLSIKSWNRLRFFTGDGAIKS